PRTEASPGACGRARTDSSREPAGGDSSIMAQAATRAAQPPLRVGVVGVGVMGSNHARVFADLPGVRLTGVADPDAKRRERVASAVGCETFPGIEGLIAAGVDAVTIAAPTHLHQELAISCIERGLHVMVE